MCIRDRNYGGVRSNDNTVRNNSSETIRTTAPVRENSNYGGVRSSNNTAVSYTHLDVYKRQKVAFITNELDLTPEESAKFWPLYNAFEDKQHEIRKQKLKVYMDRADNSVEKLSEKDATTLLNQMESTEEELHLSLIHI